MLSLYDQVKVRFDFSSSQNISAKKFMQCQCETIEGFFFNARLASFQIQTSIYIEKLKIYIVITDIIQLITEKLKDFFM